MPLPTTTIVYVTDAEVSTAFYTELFGAEPSFRSPRYVTWTLPGGYEVAIWSGGAEALEGSPRRTSELCFNVPGGTEAVEALHARWSETGVRIVEGPYDDVFGRTFLAADPDGNLLRVAPVD